MKLYVWEKVFYIALHGKALALANSEEEARSLILQQLRPYYATRYPWPASVTEEQWAAATYEEAGGIISKDYFKDRAVIEGPPSAVHSEPVAILIEGSE